VKRENLLKRDPRGRGGEPHVDLYSGSLKIQLQRLGSLQEQGKKTEKTISRATPSRDVPATGKPDKKKGRVERVRTGRKRPG